MIKMNLIVFIKNVKHVYKLIDDTRRRIDNQIINDLNQQPFVVVTLQSIVYENKLLLVGKTLLHVITTLNPV